MAGPEEYEQCGAPKTSESTGQQVNGYEVFY